MLQSWYNTEMQRHQPDPFFEQLEADLREGVEAADRGELIAADEVWQSLRDQVAEIEERAKPPH